MNLTKTTFGKTKENQTVYAFTLANDHHLSVTVINYGATITSIKAPDKNNKLDDVVLGYDSMDGYLDNPASLGATVGRFANRIADGKFSLSGVEYNLARNCNGHHLHGGSKGFSKALWQVAREIKQTDSVGVAFSHLSPNGDEGYPGNLTVQVTYLLNNHNELEIIYHAMTDRDTVINLTNHAYFNLAGAGNGNILNHHLMLNADFFLPIDKTGLPTGEILSLKNTAMDFSTAKPLSSLTTSTDKQVALAGNGLDHSFVINGTPSSLTLVGRAYEPNSGRSLEVSTTEPGVQIYTSNFGDDFVISGRDGKKYGTYCGLCLETQHFPDAPNRRHFPSTMLRAGETFNSSTIYKLGKL